MAALDVCVLHDPDLGVLSLDCLNGYVVSQYDLGYPTPRANVNDRFGADGTVDLTAYAGPRAVQLAVTLDSNGRPFSRLRDRLAAYLQPDRRPEVWLQEPGDTRIRRMQLRGSSAGLPITNPRVNRMTVAWVCPSGLIESTVPRTAVLRPTSTETGRTYPRVYDRVYTSTAGIPGVSVALLTESGDFLTTEGGDHLVTEASTTGTGGSGTGGTSGAPIVANAGTKAAQWVAVMSGALTNPTLIIGGHRLRFTANGGLTIAAGQTIIVESLGKQVYYDDGINTPALQFLDFPTSEWGLIAGGTGDVDVVTPVSMTADSWDTAGRIVLSWRDTWT